MTLPDMRRAALAYARQGLAVLPLRPGSKAPLVGSHGVLDATTDPDLIDAWWTGTPAANIGIATGGRVDVIDIDGAEGAASWLAASGRPDVLGLVRTPRPSGAHLYVAATGYGNRAGLLPGVDYRGAGGYVVAPPSVLAPASGRDYSGAYSWAFPLVLTSQR